MHFAPKFTKEDNTLHFVEKWRVVILNNKLVLCSLYIFGLPLDYTMSKIGLNWLKVYNQSKIHTKFQSNGIDIYTFIIIMCSI